LLINKNTRITKQLKINKFYKFEVKINNNFAFQLLWINLITIIIIYEIINI